MNRLTSQTQYVGTLSKTIVYSYNDNGTMASMDGPEAGTGDKVEYFYDGANSWASGTLLHLITHLRAYSYDIDFPDLTILPYFYRAF